MRFINPAVLAVLLLGWPQAVAFQAAPARCCARRGPSSISALIPSGLLHNAEAAFAASVLSTALLHPIDTLKTRQQSDGSLAERTGGLYTGLPANVLKEAPDAAVFLAISEELSRVLSSSPWFASHLTVTLLVSGAVGDAVGSVLRLPAEVVCKRQQTGSDYCWFSAFGDTSAESWLTSWSAILIRDVPST
jgi:hypothetical protein